MHPRSQSSLGTAAISKKGIRIFTQLEQGRLCITYTKHGLPQPQHSETINSLMAVTVTVKAEQSASVASLWCGLNQGLPTCCSVQQWECGYFTEAWRDSDSSTVHTGLSFIVCLKSYLTATCNAHTAGEWRMPSTSSEEEIKILPKPNWGSV